MINKIKRELEKLGSKEKAAILSRFFKSGKGEYGEGDIFLGVTVPEQRKVAKKYIYLRFNDVKKLLNSKIHEHRLTALFILMNKYDKASELERKNIFNFYLENINSINNWDLVDLSSHKILGDYLFGKDKKILYKLARSSSLWERRISIVSTYFFIRKNEFDDIFRISKILLDDKEDLIHKAVGWMLREVGKRNLGREEAFLKKYYMKMPRTMLRYAIERLSDEKKRFYMKV